LHLGRGSQCGRPFRPWWGEFGGTKRGQRPWSSTTIVTLFSFRFRSDNADMGPWFLKAPRQAAFTAASRSGHPRGDGKGVGGLTRVRGSAALQSFAKTGERDGRRPHAGEPGKFKGGVQLGGRIRASTTACASFSGRVGHRTLDNGRRQDRFGQGSFPISDARRGSFPRASAQPYCHQASEWR